MAFYKEQILVTEIKVKIILNLALCAPGINPTKNTPRTDFQFFAKTIFSFD